MKRTDIIKCLKANKKISAYELTINNKDSRELFYVLDHLEINRAVNTCAQSINVYVNDGDKTGDSIVAVTAADDAASLTKKLDAAVVKAKAAMNPYFPLPEKTVNIRALDDKKYDLNEIANNIAKAVFKANVHEQGWLNSTEIFVSKLTKEFENSNGVHHISSGLAIQIEVIPTWKGEKEEVELYKYYQSSKIDYKEITKEIESLLNNAKMRSQAVKMKDIKLPKDIKILVQDDMLERIFESLCIDASYRYAFMHMNHYKKGDKLSDNKFNVTLKPYIKGCIESKYFDSHGVVLKNKKLIKDGALNCNWGDIRFGYYNKEKKITGEYSVIELDAKRSEYKNEKHLILENFSSPQYDDSTGYWGGEIRLAKYFDGKKYIPITDFSISGNIYEDLKKVEFSKEDVILSGYKGPKYLIFKGLSIH